MITRHDYDTTMTIERDDGRTFAIDGGDWVLAKDGLDDWLSMENSINTSQNVLTDGAVMISMRLEDTDRTASALCLVEGAEDMEKARQDALSFFNPKHIYTAHIVHRDIKRYCVGALAGFDCKLKEGRYVPQLMFTLRCFDPWMRDEYSNDAKFGSSVPMLGWPFVSHGMHDPNRPLDHPQGFICGELIYDGRNTIYNHGDAEVGYRAVITARGTIVNPRIEKDGRFVQVGDPAKPFTMEAGDVLEIDFEAIPSTVTLNGENVISRTTRDSSFTKMLLQCGENTFMTTCADMANRSLMDVQVIFNAKYAGV